jgi:hypothetical protein
VKPALICAAILVAATAGAAHADEYARAVSVPVYSLQQAQGIAVEYEQLHLLPERWSVAGGLGIRDSADADFASTSLSASAEVRYWFRNGVAMRGWFVGAGLDMTWTSLTDRIDDRSIGSSLAVAETVQLGYRMVPWRQLEITPSLGIELVSDVDLTGRLPVWTHGSLTTGLTVGWLF